MTTNYIANISTNTLHQPEDTPMSNKRKSGKFKDSASAERRNARKIKYMSNGRDTKKTSHYAE